MATKKVGTLVKEARTAAGLTQEQLARKVTGASASDISELERGKVDFTQAQLKQIAKATGVTQKSLIEAPKNLGKTSSGKTSSGKTSSSSSTSSSGKTSTAATSSMKVTAAERKLVERYREADSSTKKVVNAILKGEKPDVTTGATSLLGDSDGLLESILQGALDALGKKR